MPLLAARGSTGSASGGQSNAADANNAPQSNQTPTAVVPFIRATDENLQPANLDRTSAVLGTSSQDFGITDVPAYGYISHLYLLVEATGGAAGLNNAVAKEDGPWTVLRDVALTEPNGATIVQFNDGYQAMLANKYGGYATPRGADPRGNVLFSAVATSGNFTFALRIPVAVSSRDAVGALANQDSAGQFKFKVKIGAKTDVYSTSPDTTPVVRTRLWLQGWDQPEQTSGGVANQTEPTAHGTTAFWSIQAGITVNSGDNNIQILRKGNYWRQMIFVLRRAGTSRANGESDWPTETQFLRDSFPARYYNNLIWRMKMWELTGYTGSADTAFGPENGVRFHDYMHEFDGALGRENRDLWQPTRGSTRAELKGNFANAGTLDIIVCDVAIANNVFL